MRTSACPSRVSSRCPNSPLGCCVAAIFMTAHMTRRPHVQFCGNSATSASLPCPLLIFSPPRLELSSPQVPSTSTLLNGPVAMITEGTAVMRIIASRRASGFHAAPPRADDTIPHGYRFLVPASTTSPHLNPSPSPQQASVDGSSAARRTQGTAVMRIMASRRASYLDAASFRADETSPPGFLMGTPVMRLVVSRRAARQAEASRRINADGTGNVSSFHLMFGAQKSKKVSPFVLISLPCSTSSNCRRVSW